MLPTFIVIGAGKAGTTSLWGYLDGHPDVFMAREKELNFFTTEHNWERGVAWYERHFDDAGDATARGEATGAYTNWPEYAGVPARMASVVPDARLLYVVRDPIERIVSAYRYRRVMGTEQLPIDRAVREVPMYLNVSRYASQLDRYVAHFARDRILVLRSEDLRDQREATMREAFAFIGVDPAVEPSAMAREFNRTDSRVRRPRAALRAATRVPGYRRLAAAAPPALKRGLRQFVTSEVVTADESRLTDDVRRYLEDELRDDVARLRTYLGDDFDGWGLA